MNFFNRTKGSITVLVTLILVPTIFFQGFMVDLARIKLYGSQAVMTADNYGEAVLSMYDNLLKELYGLFAVTQDKDALEQLEVLEAYLKSSFHPGEKSIGWEHLKEVQDYTGITTPLTGFMPYRDAEITLEHKLLTESALSNGDVLGSQIGDFMKFRIAMTLFEDDDAIFKTIQSVMKSGKDAEAVGKKNELAEEAQKVMEIAKDYYELAKRLNHYPEFISNINAMDTLAKAGFSEIANSESYQIYKDYMLNKEAIEEALKRQEELEEGEELSEEDQEYIEMYEAYVEDEDAREDVLNGKFEDAILLFISSVEDDTVDFESFDGLVRDLKGKAKDLKSELVKLKDCRDSLERVLDSGEVSEKVKTGMEDEIRSLDELFASGGTYSADNYINLAEYIGKNSGCNADFKSQSKEMLLRMGEIKDAYMELSDHVPEFYSALTLSSYKDFMDVSAYSKLYRALFGAFEPKEGSENEKYVKAKRAEAEDMQKDAEKKLSEKEETKARDIPEEFGFGNNGSSMFSDFSNLIENAAYLFQSNSFAEAGNKLLIKVYTVAYDFGMFSSRVTNVKQEENQKPKESLTGYEMAANINYLYQAELEYIFGGHNSSADNLEAARNRILAFRTIANYTATYTVTPVNSCILTISSTANAILPGLGLLVSGALRLAVAGIETACDWDELKKGESVVLFKSELGDMTAVSKFSSLIGLSDTNQTASGEVKLNYEQYLLIMVIFFTTDNQLYERTGNLITLNVNTVKKKVGETGTLTDLEFRIANAYTAVEASCLVQMDFVVMPDGFAKQVVDEDTYSAIESFEKNAYKFKVTRGY